MIRAGVRKPNLVAECKQCGARIEVPPYLAHRKAFCSRACVQHYRSAHSKAAYRSVFVPDHPRASGSGCVSLHVLVAEKALGHFLPDGAHVHHVDENKRNNANTNLVICQDAAYHKLLHLRRAVVRAGGNPNTQRICPTCKQLVFISDSRPLTRQAPTNAIRECRPCQRARNRQRKERLAVECQAVR
jgi:hypothetical protein